MGTAAMAQSADFPRQHFPQANYMFLVVNQRNAHARRVYEKEGFAAWFVRDGGEHSPQWVMRKVIRAGPGRQGWNTATERENGTFLDSAQGCLEGGVQGVRRAF